MHNVNSILSANHKITTTLYVSLENNVSKNALVFEKNIRKEYLFALYCVLESVLKGDGNLS